MWVRTWLKSLFARPPLLAARVYTRKACGLCEEAAEQLRSEGFVVEFVDIDDDPALRARYDVVIPVVEIEGKERFRGRVNPILLRRLADNLRRNAGRQAKNRNTGKDD